MPNEILAFDALASNIDGSNPGTVLNIGPGTPYLLREFSAPAPSQTVQYAGSADTEGSLPASRKHENRVLSMKITCSTAASLRTLQDKIGKVAREGGTLKWVLPNAETVIFDLHATDTFDPAFDVTWQKNAGAYCEVQIVLPAMPYGRGPSVTLSAHSETTLPALTFTETGIKGDMPALGTLAVDNTDAALPSEKALIWGLENRYTNTGVPLFVEAEETTFGSFSFPMTGSLVTGAAGASGGASNNAIRKTSAGSGTSYYSLLYKRFVSRGVFNVYARVWCPSANTGTTTVRMRWGNIAAGALATNPVVTLDSSWEGSWRLVSLGQAYARSQYTTPTAGDWGFIFEANMPTAADVIDVDFFLVVPVMEGSGIIDSSDSPVGTTGPSGDFVISHNTVQRYGVGPATAIAGYDRPLKYEGDYLLIPPAGAEARTLRMIVKMSRGVITTDADSAIDDLSATLTYIPRYLVVPSP